MGFLANIWDFLWFAVTIFVFIAYLMALFSIISDLFRDKKLPGVAKAIWLIFLVFLPFLTAIVYLIARGRGMGERAAAQAQATQNAADDYIRSVAVHPHPAEQIAQAKKLLDEQTITQEEFDTLKRAALDKAASA
ncbi:SHOCT domain-containing protein [Leucobacter sp. HY1910]